MDEVEEFWENIWIWKQFEDFYVKYPNHPSKYIHEEAKKRMEKFW